MSWSTHEIKLIFTTNALTGWHSVLNIVLYVKFEMMYILQDGKHPYFLQVLYCHLLDSLQSPL